jgi:gliding motility-associated protein GldC
MDTTVVKKSKIEIEIGLNQANLPVEMKWQSSDAPAGYPMQEAKAMQLTFFDKPSQDTLRIDLWTTDMQVVEMDKMMYDTLRTMADNYFRATNNREMAEQMRHFANYFGEKTALIKPQ